MSYILDYCKQHLQEEDYIFISTIFKNCPEYIQSQMEIINYEKNQAIMETGDANTYVYFLLKGKVAMVDEKVPSIPFTFGEYKAIDVLGDYELFSNVSGRFVSLRTNTPCTCIRIHSGDYMNWIKADVNALFIRVNMIMSVLSRETQFMRQFVFLDMETRIIVYFYEEYLKREVPRSIRINATREEIAGKMACSIRTLNRSLQKIEKNGFITRYRGKIYINIEQFKKIEAFVTKNNISIDKLLWDGQILVK